jgi:hypothetical protein
LDPTVLVVSQINEPSTDVVVGHLARIGVRTLRINSEEIAYKASLSASVGGSQDTFDVSWLGLDCDKTHLLSVWHRRWSYPIYPEHFTEATVSFCFSETTALLGGLSSFSGLTWINDVFSERRASNKITQLNLARTLSFRIPKTLITNRSEDVEIFFGQNSRGTIFKPLSGSSILYRSYRDSVLQHFKVHYPGQPINVGQIPADHVIYTELLDPGKLPTAEDLRWSPVIFQEFIDKEVDVRVTVIGESIFACNIYSQEVPETKVDFRRMNEGRAKLRHEIVSLPDHVTRFIHGFMHAMGLRFACLDFIIDSRDGQFVFLEANPAGQWLWIERLTGAPISQAVANYLVQPTLP